MLCDRNYFFSRFNVFFRFYRFCFFAAKLFYLACDDDFEIVRPGTMDYYRHALDIVQYATGIAYIESKIQTNYIPLTVRLRQIIVFCILPVFGTILPRSKKFMCGMAILASIE